MRPLLPVMALASLLLAGAAPLPPAAIVAAAPPDAWRPIAPENLLVMDLGGGRRVVIELAPAFAPVHVANIRALARSGWWDGAAIVRVQDDYVVQWARPDGDRALPPGVSAHPPAEYDRPAGGIALRPLGSVDAYAPRVGYAEGWPAATDGTRVWLAHCYGAVGVARDMPPDTGDGSQLYGVIGEAPRQLDRNIALVGRIVDGIELLAALPRGTAELGFYARPDQRLPILSVRVAADLPQAGRPRYQAMRDAAPAFAAYLDARANRRDRFFVRPSGGVALCNAPVPVRPAP